MSFRYRFIFVTSPGCSACRELHPMMEELQRSLASCRRVSLEEQSNATAWVARLMQTAGGSFTPSLLCIREHLTGSRVDSTGLVPGYSLLRMPDIINTTAYHRTISRAVREMHERMS